MRTSRYAVRAYAPRSPLTRMGASSVAAALTVAGLVVGLGLPSATAAPGGRHAVATVTGTVERIHLDDFAHPQTEGSDEVTFVRTSDGSLQVPADELAQVPSGARVRLGLADTRGARPGATGALVSSLTAAQERDPQSGPSVASVEVLATAQAGQVSTGTGVATTDAAVAAGTALHSVLVVVVRPPGGATTSVTASQIASTISNGVNSYWSSVTNGAVGFTATAYPSVISTTSAPCSSGGSVSGSGTFWSEVQSKTGWTSGSGRHLVVYFPAYSACGGIAGLGTVGGGIASGGVVWSNGYGTGSQGIGVIGHELGHNIGLGHSQLLDCSVSGVRVMDTDAASCSSRSYADTNDIMAVSWNYQGFLNAVHLRTLGLLGSGDQTMSPDPVTGATSGQVTLQPIETASGMRVLTLTSGGTHYVLEYRQPVGRDSWMATYPSWGSTGVTVRKEFDPAAATGFRSIESYLLDGDPATSDAGFGAMSNTLPVGDWITFDNGQLGVRVVSMSGAGAVVDYTSSDPSTDPRYVAPIVPTVSTPIVGLGIGTMKPTRYGPYVPLVWRWTVATPSSDPTAAATVTSGRYVAPSVRMASSTWYPIAYRAVALASNQTPVAVYGHARTHYWGERLTTIVKYSRGWTTKSTSVAVGGSLRTTTRKGAVVTFRVTSRAVGVLLGRGSAYGSVAVYLDGQRVKILNQRAGGSRVVLAWSATFATKGTHTVKLVNLTGGTSGRVGFDGLVGLL